MSPHLIIWKKQIIPLSPCHMLGTPFMHFCLTLSHLSSPSTFSKIGTNSGTSAHKSPAASQQPVLQMAPLGISVLFLGNWIGGEHSLHCCVHTWTQRPLPGAAANWLHRQQFHGIQKQVLRLYMQTHGMGWVQ